MLAPHALLTSTSLCCAGNWMLFGVSQAGVPSTARTLTIGQLPRQAAGSATASSSRVASDGGAQATDDGGTAAPLDESFPATPAEPKVEYPQGLQND